MIMQFQGGIFLYMVKAEVLFGAPIFLTLLVGYFSKTVSAKAANITLVSYLVLLSLSQFAFPVELHYLHLLAALFIVHVVMLFGLSKVFPLDRPIEPTTPDSVIDLTPWKHFKLVGGLSVVFMIATYVIFSPWGLVKEVAEKHIDYGYIVGGLIIATLVFLVPLRIARRDRAAR